MILPRRPGTLVACLALAACDAGAPVDDGAPLVLSASDLHLLGTSDSLAAVEDMAVLDDGTVWVQNSLEPLFLAFDASGLVTAHGRSGGGPEEFGAPAGFVVGGLEGEAWTLDRRRHLLVRVSGDDGERAEVRLPEEIARGSVSGGMSLLSGQIRTAPTVRARRLRPRRRRAGRRRRARRREHERGGQRAAGPGRRRPSRGNPRAAHLLGGAAAP
jgi:hypothetical protein